MGGKEKIFTLFLVWEMTVFLAVGVKADWSTSWDTDEDWRGGTYENVCIKEGRISIGVYPSDPFFDSGGWYGETKKVTEVDEVYAEVRNNQAYFYARDSSGWGGEDGEAYGHLLNTFYFDATGIKENKIKLSFWWKAYTTDFDQGNSRTSLSLWLRRPDGVEVELWSRSYTQPQSGTIHDGTVTIIIGGDNLRESGFYTLRITAYWYLNPTRSFTEEHFHWYIDDIHFDLTSGVHITFWRDMGVPVAWKTLQSTASISSGQGITTRVEVSDDGVNSKGSYEIPLFSGTFIQNLYYLPVARYVRLITNFTTFQAGTSPFVDSYVLTVDPVPSLSLGGVTPEKGGLNTTFTFTVTYQDSDGDPPVAGYPKVYIDGIGYEMTKIRGDYVTGATYQFLIATLPPGTHSYWFEAFDGTTFVRFPAVGTFFGPTVNTPPTLSSGGVSPSSGSVSTLFTFTVTYADPDGDPPLYVKVYIDDVPYDMTRTGGNYTSGVIYSYTTTLGSGTHQYFFLASDGIETVRLPATGAFSGPTVIGEVPRPTLWPLTIVLVIMGGALGATLLWKLGKPKKELSSTLSRVSKFCPRCKLELPGEADFCPQCGRKIEKAK